MDRRDANTRVGAGDTAARRRHPLFLRPDGRLKGRRRPCRFRCRSCAASPGRDTGGTPPPRCGRWRGTRRPRRARCAATPGSPGHGPARDRRASWRTRPFLPVLEQDGKPRGPRLHHRIGAAAGHGVENHQEASAQQGEADGQQQQAEDEVRKSRHGISDRHRRNAGRCRRLTGCLDRRPSPGRSASRWPGSARGTPAATAIPAGRGRALPRPRGRADGP